MYKKQKGQHRMFKRSLLDKNFNLEANYFEKDLSQNDWKNIETYVSKFLSGNTSESLKTFFNKYPDLRKGDKNIENLRKIFNTALSKNPNSAEKYQEGMNFIIDNLYIPRPSVCEAVFFPGEEHENKVVNMLRTCKYSLDICIFTMTNDKLFEAVEECWNANIDVRIITDDECVKQRGSDVYKLAAIGVPVKTDSNAQYHMHHKFVVIDKKVLITGSFNRTVQAVKNNNENVIMLQNKELVDKYVQEFDRLWGSFKEEISEEEAKNNL